MCKSVAAASKSRYWPWRNGRVRESQWLESRCHKILETPCINLGTPGLQIHHYFGDSFVKLGTPYRTRTHVRSVVRRGYSTALKLRTQLLSKGSSGHSELTSYKEDGLHQSAHSSSGFRWLPKFADWQHSRCRRLQRQWNSRSWEPKKWSEIQECWWQSLYVGGGKLAVAICLLPQYLFSLFCMEQDLNWSFGSGTTCGWRSWSAWYKEAHCSYSPFIRKGNQASVCQCTGKQH